jgi:hypothetical protein
MSAEEHSSPGLFVLGRVVKSLEIGLHHLDELTHPAGRNNDPSGGRIHHSPLVASCPQRIRWVGIAPFRFFHDGI